MKFTGTGECHMSKENTCCFFGHRKIENADELEQRVKSIAEDLIINKKIDTFLFGSKSEFDSLCLSVVSELRVKYPHIKRIYVRAEYPEITEHYKKYLLEDYEDTYYPERIADAGRAVYVERNCEMIDNSAWCVVYCNENYIPPERKTGKNSPVPSCRPNSGTKRAYDYAKRKRRQIINTYLG